MSKELRQLIRRGEKALEYFLKPLPPLTLIGVEINSDGHFVRKGKESNMPRGNLANEILDEKVKNYDNDVIVTAKRTGELFHALYNKVRVMEKDLDMLINENNDLKEQVAKLKKLHPEAGL